MTGVKWELGLLLFIIILLLLVGWRYLHSWKLPVSWPWIMLYAGFITGLCEVIYLTSKVINEVVPIQIESFCRLLFLVVCWPVHRGKIRIVMIHV